MVVDDSPYGASRVPALRWFLTSLLVGLVIAMREIDRLIGMLPDKDARTWTLEGPVMGVPQLWTGSLDPWRGFAQAVADGAGARFFWCFLFLDLAFVSLYSWGLTQGAQRSQLVRLLTRQDGASWWLRRPFTPFVYVLALTDLLEDAFAAAVIYTGAEPFMCAASFTSKAKWVVAALLMIRAIVALAKGEEGVDARVRVGRGLRALYAHRFSMLALMPLSILALVPVGDLGDQIPDVLRQWTSYPSHAIGALILLLFEVFALFTLGRLVSEHEWRRANYDGPSELAEPMKAEQGRWWFFAPGVAAVGLVATDLSLGWRWPPPGIRWRPFAAMWIVPSLVVGVSLALTHCWAAKTKAAPSAVVSAAPNEVVRVTGDLLATAGLSVGALALVRAFTAEMTLAPSWQPALGLAVGVLGIAVIWGLVNPILNIFSRWGEEASEENWLKWIYRELTPGLSPHLKGSSETLPPGQLETAERRLAKILLVTSAGLLSVICVFPWAMARWGAVAVTLLCLVSVSVLMGATVQLHRSWPTPSVFQWGPLHMRETPVIFLMLLLFFAGSMWGGSDLHLARGVATGTKRLEAKESRPTLSEALEVWVEATAQCQVTVGNLHVRPLILVAAEGGGARAAYWTARVLDQLDAPSGTQKDRPTCGSAQVFLAAGVSGGSVGLAASRFQPGLGDAAAEVSRLGSPTALAVGSVGLFVRDTASGVSGIPFGVRDAPGVPGVPGSAGEKVDWVDRAGLIEQAWESASPALAKPFLEPPTRANGGFGANLVFASTTVSTGCRVLVSQIALPETVSNVFGDVVDSVTKDTGRSTPCADAQAAAPFSMDLVARYGPTGTGNADTHPPDRERCLANLSAATAAMFSARFPFVTPSGVVGPCGGSPQEQLVDGGYAEGTGLGVLVDLAPELMPLIRERNHQLAGFNTVIVPIVMYLDNGTGSDLAPAAPGPTIELFVPSVAKGRASTTQGSTYALLQRLVDLTDPTRLVPHRDDLHQLLGAMGHRVSVVFQETTPAVTAPLGWVLSEASTGTMDAAVALSAKCGETLEPSQRNQVEALANRGYGRLYDVIKALGHDQCSAPK